MTVVLTLMIVTVTSDLSDVYEGDPDVDDRTS